MREGEKCSKDYKAPQTKQSMLECPMGNPR